jgi:hypothetical protein
MDDIHLYHRIIRPFAGRGGVRDIVSVEVRSRDIDCWLVALRTRQGDETRVTAASEEEAREMAACIDAWRQQPESVPAAPALLSRRAAGVVFWIVFLLVAVGMAVHGLFAYSLVSGWVLTRHFLFSFCVAAVVTVALFASIGAPGHRHPFQWGALVVCLALVIVFAGAGKTLNARLAAPQPVAVEGPIVLIDDEHWDIQATQRTRIKADLVVMQVEDGKSRQRYQIEVPAWVAEREGVRPGAVWRDRFQRGAFGWLYRDGTVWDERPFRPGVVQGP